MILNVELSNRHMRETRDFSMTVTELEETICGYSYKGEGLVKDPVVENTQFPPIALSFYSYIYEYDSVPSPETLINIYICHKTVFLLFRKINML